MTDPIVTLTIPNSTEIVLCRMSTRESLGEPFEFQLELASNSLSLQYADFIGQSVTVAWQLPPGVTRYFNGIVTSFGHVATVDQWQVYRAILRPWFWLLSRTADCRIFQNQSVVDIFKTVCSEFGFSDYKLQLSETYEPREYCVQYRETAFDFISRLLEFEGIYYYFTHQNGTHFMVLSDSTSTHEAATDYTSLSFCPDPRLSEYVDSWTSLLELQSGSVVLNDYDYENPKTDLTAQKQAENKYPYSTFEVFDYPGCYTSKNVGDSYVRARIDEIQSQDCTILGTSNAQGIATGAILELTNHPRTDQNTTYLIVSSRHQFVNSDVVPECQHTCEFTVIPQTYNYRMPRKTPVPKIAGIQTAVVTGESGDEIYTDSLGRLKVQFYWDRLGTNDQNSSCWIRVAQSLAGKGWGAQFLPRIGHEVVVEFLEGNPDRPLITGSVYNGNLDVPFVLPANATQSGIKTQSTKDGTDQTFNELMFDDNKGKETIYFHAERDFQRVVENNDSLTVGLQTKDAGNQTIEIYNNRTVTLDQGSDTLNIQNGNRSVTISVGNDTLLISKGNRTLTVSTGDDQLTVSQGNRSVTVGGGNDTLTVSKGNRTVAVSAGNDALTVSQGNHSITVSAGTSTITAATSVELKVGGNSVTINSSGITLTGSMISINASGTLTLKGATVNIN